jgi:hypothetical protein
MLWCGRQSTQENSKSEAAAVQLQGDEVLANILYVGNDIWSVYSRVNTSTAVNDGACQQIFILVVQIPTDVLDREYRHREDEVSANRVCFSRVQPE